MQVKKGIEHLRMKKLGRLFATIKENQANQDIKLKIITTIRYQMEKEDTIMLMERAIPFLRAAIKLIYIQILLNKRKSYAE